MTIASRPQTQIDYRGMKLFVGVDVGKKSWQVTIRTAQREVRTISMPPKAAVLIEHLEREYCGGDIVVGYEAGYSGFWLQRALTAHAIRCVVLNPADIASTDKDRRQKSDRVDARRIAEELATETRPLRTVYVPSIEHEEARLLVRARQQAVNSSVRARMRTTSLLDQMGIEHPAGKRITYSAASMQWLRSVELQTPTGTEALRVHLDDVDHSQAQVADLTRRLLKLATQAPWQATAKLLESVTGLGSLSAIIWAVEIGPWNRFPSADHLVSYVGLVPSYRQSSQTEKTLGMTPRASAQLRPMIIQSAHAAKKSDPELRVIFQTMLARGKTKQEATAYVAKRIVLRMRAVVMRGTPYEKREVPRKKIVAKKVTPMKPEAARPRL